MTIDDLIYTLLRALSAGCGFYIGWFFIRLARELPQPPHIKMPFYVLGIGNLATGIVYTLAVLHIDGFGNISNTGRIIQIIIFGYQVMPYVIAKNMRGI